MADFYSFDRSSLLFNESDIFIGIFLDDRSHDGYAKVATVRFDDIRGTAWSDRE